MYIFGKDAIKIHYDGFFKTYFSEHGDGIAIVTKEQKYSAIDENWDVVIPFEYARLNTCSEQFIDTGKNIIEYSKQAYNLYKQQTTKEKRKLLNIIFDNITIKDRTIKYIYKKPFCYFAKCDLKNTDEIIDYVKQSIIN